METKLKIPRHHFKYLEQHGTLAEFVRAKQDDDDAAARQALDKTLELDKMKRKSKIMSVDQVDGVPQSSNNLKMYQPLS